MSCLQHKPTVTHTKTWRTERAIKKSGSSCREKVKHMIVFPVRVSSPQISTCRHLWHAQREASCCVLCKLKEICKTAPCETVISSQTGLRKFAQLLQRTCAGWTLAKWSTGRTREHNSNRRENLSPTNSYTTFCFVDSIACTGTDSVKKKFSRVFGHRTA